MKQAEKVAAAAAADTLPNGRGATTSSTPLSLQLPKWGLPEHRPWDQLCLTHSSLVGFQQMYRHRHTGGEDIECSQTTSCEFRSILNKPDAYTLNDQSSSSSAKLGRLSGGGGCSRRTLWYAGPSWTLGKKPRDFAFSGWGKSFQGTCIPRRQFFSHQWLQVLDVLAYD